MKTLVVYFSQTGNTRKVAQAIHSVLPAGTELKELAEVTSLDEYGLIFVGFPVHAFGPAAEAKTFLSACAAGKRIALFITHASLEEAPQLASILDKCREAARGAVVTGLFHCQGELSTAIAEMLIKSGNPELEFYGKQRQSTIGQPDQYRLEKAAEFAKKVYAEERINLTAIVSG